MVTGLDALAARRPRLWSAVRAIAVAGLLAPLLLRVVSHWDAAFAEGSFLGGDLVAYQRAAQRLVETGSPYSDQVLRGPIDHSVVNIPIGYFYPPPLAQLFMPFASVDHRLLGAAWAGAQVVTLAYVLPRVLKAGGGHALEPSTAAVIVLFVLGSAPLHGALFGGNVSGWAAAGIGIALYAGPRAAGVTAALMTLKPTAAPLAMVALAARPSRGPAIATLLVIGAISLLAAPRAWVEWPVALLNAGRMPPALSGANVSPAAVLEPFGLATVGWLLGGLAAVHLAAWASWRAFRVGANVGSVSLAVLAMLLSSATLWGHYLVALVPLVLFAWPSSGRRLRLVIWILGCWQLLTWTAAAASPLVRGVWLALTAATCVGIAASTTGTGSRTVALRSRRSSK